MKGKSINDRGSPTCVVFDTKTKKWVKSGVSFVSEDANSVSCTASLLSKFAIIDDSSNDGDFKAWYVIVPVVLGSAIILIGVGLFFFCKHRGRKSNSAKINPNMGAAVQ